MDYNNTDLYNYSGRYDNNSTDLIGNTSKIPCTYHGVYYKSYVGIIVVACVAVVLNVLAVVAVHKATRTLNCHHLLVVHQCVVDTVYAISFLLAATYLTSWCSMVSSKTQSCVRMFLYSLVSATFYLVFTNLLVISVDNFIAVYKPIRYRLIVTKARIYRVILLLYIMWIIYLGTPFFIAMSKSGYTFGDICSQRNNESIVVMISINLSTFVVSVLVLFPMYGYIFYRTLYRKNQHLFKSADQRSNRFRKSLTSLLVIVTFSVCFHIDLVLLSLQLFPGKIIPSQIVNGATSARQVTIVLPALNCICDPLIYAIRLPKVQKGYAIMARSLGNVCRIKTNQGTIK